MHDCPRCGVPLHGHERVCPACDMPQPVSRGISRLLEDIPEARINWIPPAVAIVIVIAAFALLAKGSWIGQLLSQPPVQENPLDRLTYREARKIVEDKIMQELAQFTPHSKIYWRYEDKTVTPDNPNTVQLMVETSLPSKADNDSLMDSVKDYMPRANIAAVVVKDAKTHATWTSTVSVPLPRDPNAE